MCVAGAEGERPEALAGLLMLEEEQAVSAVVEGDTHGRRVRISEFSYPVTEFL